MLPAPATPAQRPATGWNFRVPRNAALVMLRNNVCSLAGLMLINWFIPIYPRLKALFLPHLWLKTFSKLELGALGFVFGINIVIALVSIRFPRDPYPPFKTPSKPPVKATPVRRPIKSLGTSPASRPSLAKSFTSSGYASTPMSTPSRMLNYSVPSSAGTPLNYSGFSSLSASSSFNTSPLAAYMGRHAVPSGRPIDTPLLDSLTADDNPL